VPLYGYYCETLRHLAENFSLSARLYAEAVVRMTLTLSTEAPEYPRFREAAHEAHERAEQARVAFEEHIATHRCVEGHATQSAASS
jgi:hypothetical protein